MKVLVCDIDNTVADQMKSLVNLKKSTSQENFLNKAYSINHISKYDVLKNAIDAINLFKKNNFKIIWLTARKIKFKEVTENWLKSNNFPIDELILVDKIANKIDVINNIRPDIIIDDCKYNQHNLNPLLATEFIDAVSSRYNLFVFQNNWNYIIENFDKVISNNHYPQI